MNIVQTANTRMRNNDDHDLDEFKGCDNQRMSDRDKQIMKLYSRLKDNIGALSNDFSASSKTIHSKLGDYLCCINRLTTVLESALIAKNIGTYETGIVSKKEYVFESNNLKEMHSDIIRLKADLNKSLDNLISFSSNCIIEGFINKNTGFNGANEKPNLNKIDNGVSDLDI